jgi:pyruvate dehydrogenase E2 component (dihydrolipoamide acetyltransferase)
MSAEINMPQQSDTMTEGTVVKWLVKEGEKVKSGQTIAEIETDKATMETESKDAGTVAAILAGEGQKVPVGGIIAVLATGSENPADVKKKYAGGAGAAKPSPQPASVTQAREMAQSARRPPGQSAEGSGAESGPAHSLQTASHSEIHEPAGIGHGATRSAATAVPELASRAGNGNGHGERVFASPLARRIAADKQIDLSQIQGTGPGGRIVQKDVLSFTARPAPTTGQKQERPALAARIARGESQVVPLTKMRAAIAAGLQKSKQNVPHFYVTIDADVEDLSALRFRLNKQLESEKVKLSISDFISKAIATALLRHPAVNAHFTGDSITRFGDVNLGIAVAIPDGLIVPVLRNVDQMGLREIRIRSEELIARARNQKLKQDEMRGATFTISNLGTYGIREFSAIINPPEVAILAVAAAEKRPVVRGDQIVPRTMMSLTLSADHRAVDGATAADFLRTLKALLEEPGMMLV